MINKIVQKYLERKGYVAVKKSTIDYTASVMDVSVNEIRKYYSGNKSIEAKLISDLLAVKYRLKYYRLE